MVSSWKLLCCLRASFFLEDKSFHFGCCHEPTLCSGSCGESWLWNGSRQVAIDGGALVFSSGRLFCQKFRVSSSACWPLLSSYTSHWPLFRQKKRKKSFSPSLSPLLLSPPPLRGCCLFWTMTFSHCCSYTLPRTWKCYSRFIFGVNPNKVKGLAPGIRWALCFNQNSCKRTGIWMLLSKDVWNMGTCTLPLTPADIDERHGCSEPRCHQHLAGLGPFHNKCNSIPKITFCFPFCATQQIPIISSCFANETDVERYSSIRKVWCTANQEKIRL